jgi:hypothetical protein
MVQIILGYRESSIAQIKGQVLFKEEILTKIQKWRGDHLKLIFTRTLSDIL